MRKKGLKITALLLVVLLLMQSAPLEAIAFAASGDVAGNVQEERAGLFLAGSPEKSLRMVMSRKTEIFRKSLRSAIIR